MPIKMKSSLIVFILSIFAQFAESQVPVQTLRGVITDKDSKQSLPGATVVILNTDPLLGTTSDADGKFKISNIPVGRYSVKISYIGYEPSGINELLIGSGKEVVLNIELKESLSQLGEVNITAENNKDRTINSMAMVSARQVSVEEASRYAGSIDDPARLVAAYAGVSGNFASNGIVIRGNSPRGLKWRMEGADIPNPSHFAEITAFGAGAFTALSSQMLSNSDFFTGAFPAEYGNALSGVFDLHLRNGNTENYEHTFQAGTLGIDISSEGPFKRGKGSSYLFNYRYSTFALIAPLLPDDAGGIRYQDLSLKMNYPLGKNGTLSAWGIGALDRSTSKAETDMNNWEFYQDREQVDSRLGFAAGGIQYKLLLGSRSWISNSLAYSGNFLGWEQDRLDSNMLFYRNEEVDNLLQKISLSSSYNHKFSSRHSNRTGFIINYMDYNIRLSNSATAGIPLQSSVDDQGRSHILQFFTQSRFDLSEKTSCTAGVHVLEFGLGNVFSIEPRFQFKWQFNPVQSVSFGYGLHSQTELLPFYLVEFPDGNKPNKNMGFTGSHHIVLAYEWLPSENLRIKAEPYIQLLYHVPVKDGTSFSMLNLEQDWFLHDTLIPEGTGRNLGIDLTVERFLVKGFYYLLSASVFRSYYTGGDGIERPTRYDRRFTANFLCGREWKTGPKKHNLFGLNLRLTIMGGERLTPVLENESFAAGEVINDESRAFEDKKPDPFVACINLTYRKNKTRYAGTWSLQLVNFTGTREHYGYRMNLKTGYPEAEREMLIFPNISYKVEF